MSVSPFHLAIPVKELNQTKDFYIHVLECEQGRSSDVWQDLNFFGHQLVLHIDKQEQPQKPHNEVDGKHVPIPHFGVVLPWTTFFEFAEKLKRKSVKFIIEPYLRFEGKTGEQATMFFYDPSGNALEFKSFRDPKELFAS